MITNRLHIFILLNVIIIHSHNLDLESDIPLSISFNPIIEQIQQNHSLTIRCEVKKQTTKQQPSSLHTFSMFLYCPLASKDKFCFQNCQSACVGRKTEDCPNSGELAQLKCQTVSTQTGHVYYEYVIPRLTKKWFNNHLQGFSCKTAGFKTVEIKLKEVESRQKNFHSWITIPEEVSTTVRPTTVSAPIPPAQKQGRINDQMSTNKNIPLEINTEYELKAAVTREVLIIGSLVIVFLSLILNVFCCIRCALIKQYSKSKGRVHMQHLFCMSDEIKNARLVRQCTAPIEFNQRKMEMHHLEGNNGFNVGVNNQRDNILLNRLINTNGADFYQPHIAYTSDYVHNPNCASLTGISDVHDKLCNSRTNSRYSFNPIQQQGSPVQQQQIASAFANFYLQHPQHFQELKQHITDTSELGSIHQTGSDGLGSCFGSVGQPDSSLLDVNFSAHNGHGINKINYQPVEAHAKSCSSVITTRTMTSARASTPITTNKLSLTSGQFINMLDTAHLGQFTAVPTVVNLAQPVNSIPTQCLRLASSNPLIITNPIGVISPSQSDSGAGSGSGKISIESENRLAVHTNDSTMDTKINSNIQGPRAHSLVFPKEVHRLPNPPKL